MNELRKPAVETAGEYMGKWFVMTTSAFDKHKFGALYADGRSGNMLGTINMDVNGDNSMYYFDNEAEAHSQAHAYYESYAKPYPYYAKWMGLLNPTQGVTKEEPVKSKVMEF